MKSTQFGKESVNSRIKISYKKGFKPKVTFGYPKGNRKYLTRGSMLFPIFLIWVLISVLFLGVFKVNISPIQFSGDLKYGTVSLIYLLFMLCYFFIIPIIMYYPTRKYWQRLYPKYMKLRSIGNSYIGIFYPNDVKNNQIEIPLFTNIFLDYQATEDFSKYLEEFEIKEHPFMCKEIHTSNGKKKGEKLDKYPNEWLWKATFKFSQKPKLGKLIVEFL